MSAASVDLAARSPLGRSLVAPTFDALMIAGGLSLLVPLVAAAFGGLAGEESWILRLPVLLFFTNNAHFASSTVRLYSKSGSFEKHGFLTMGLPLVTMLVVGLCLLWPEFLAKHLQALYLTWSPYHYAAQTFGVASLYCVRSGVPVEPHERRWLRWACLLPFAVAFLGGRTSGIGWVLGPELIVSRAWLVSAINGLQYVCAGLAFAAPLAFAFWRVRRGRAMPWLGLGAMLINACWFVIFDFYEAFAWATIFHGLQYLSLVFVFHVREQVAKPGNTQAGWVHGLRFYAMCLALTYLLFQVWPYGFAFLGFGWAESMLVTIAAINLHHFVVDAYIWKFGGRDSNRQVAEQGTAAAPLPG